MAKMHLGRYSEYRFPTWSNITSARTRLYTCLNNFDEERGEMSITKFSVFSASKRPLSEEPARQPKERPTSRQQEPSLPAGQFAGLSRRPMRGSQDKSNLPVLGDQSPMSRRSLSSPAFAKSVRNAPSSAQVGRAALGEGFQRWLASPRPTMMTVTPITGGESREVLVRPWPHKPGVYQVMNSNGSRMLFTVTRSTDGRWMMAPEMKAAADDGQGDSQPYGGNQEDHWNTDVPFATPGYGNPEESGQNLYATPPAGTPAWWYGPQPASHAASVMPARYPPSNAAHGAAYTPDPHGYEQYETPDAYTDFATPAGMPPFLNPPASSASAPEGGSGMKNKTARKSKPKSMKTAPEKGSRKLATALATLDKVKHEVPPQAWERAETWMAQNTDIKTKVRGVIFDKKANAWKSEIKKKTIASISVIGKVTAEMAKTAALAARYHEEDILEWRPVIADRDSLYVKYTKLPPDVRDRAAELVRQSTSPIGGVTNSIRDENLVFYARGINTEHLGQASAKLDNKEEIEMAKITATAYRLIYDEEKDNEHVSAATDKWASNMNYGEDFSAPEVEAPFDQKAWE